MALDQNDGPVEILLTTILSAHKIPDISPPILEKEISHLSFREYAADTLSDSLNFRSQIFKNFTDSMRLRIAYHLSPIEAIDYDSSDTTPREKYISSHLIKNFKLAPDTAEQLSRLISGTLKDYHTNRANLRKHLPNLLTKQEGKCATCKFSFSQKTEKENIFTSGDSDPFKPYFWQNGSHNMMNPEVDHIEPISGFGTNQISNLQVLCSLCNRGKDDDQGVAFDHEIKNSTTNPDEMKEHHRAKMFYTRISMDQFICTKCNSNENEISVRKKISEGPYVLSNLYSVCYSCIAKI